MLDAIILSVCLFSCALLLKCYFFGTVLPMVAQEILCSNMSVVSFRREQKLYTRSMLELRLNLMTRSISF
jgi:hypothetical protein